ncbi:hypothetical protein Clacol_005475 [Clathrus columnatus]|uniref:Uncharacterized protein n=1 Tax=Clathrus columnatus TaxID=1419009 RepID=A0AAV5ADP4_9AGAM|nr:hypothetical protein Clacol_005475 [Clathrus columnatus]
MITTLLNDDASKSRGRKREINQIYAYPLPILFSPPEPQRQIANVGLFHSWRTKIENPQCQGIFDHNTLSVWIVNENDTMILWRRGFFALTAEEMTAKRRAERQQYKLDRAQAFAASVAEAEAAFAAGKSNIRVAPLTREAIANFVAQRSQRETPDLSDSIPHETDMEGLQTEDTLEEIPENLEHLHLTLSEAFFLIWALDCLYLIDSETVISDPI